MSTFFLYSSPTQAIAYNLNNKELSTLTNKISKNYSNKFCNGIGFGLSQESALTFAINENKQIYKKQKGIDQISQTDLSDLIATNVIQRCGDPIGLSGPNGIEEFKQLFLKVNSNVKIGNK